LRTAEIIASRILFWGGVLSILLMTLGIVGALRTHGAPGAVVARPEGGATAPLGRPTGVAGLPPTVYSTVGEVARAWNRWPVEPTAVVTTGILLLLATPVVGTVAVFVVFAVRGERRYAGIAAVLIAALLVSAAFVNR
jgi:uncharacterized membrane protein